jgi:hypothetical protein
MLSQKDMMECQGGGVDGDEEPDIDKLGSYNVLESSFDTLISGNVIYSSGGNLTIESYYLNVEFTNPSDTTTITNFTIISDDPDRDGSYLRRSGRTLKTDEKIKLASLVTVDGLYMDGNRCPNNDCSIKPGETLRLTLRGTPIESICQFDNEDSCEEKDICVWNDVNIVCEQGQDRVTREAEAKVKFAYNYTGEGKYEFIVANSDDVLRPLLENRMEPTSSAGPLDVKVYFAPNAYVLRQGVEEPKIGVVVKLMKDEAGTAYIQDEIRIIRLEDGMLSPPQTCSSPWGGALTLTPDGQDSELLLLGVERSLKESHTYVCEYDLVGPVEDDGEVIPFIVRADYRYEKTITNSGIQVGEEG